MPLIQCVDCGRDISSEAPACPHCGRPVVGAQPASVAQSGTSTPLALGIIGSAVLFFGTFAPIVSLPFVGSQNYFQNGRGDGVIIAILAALSILIAMARRYRYLWITGIASLGILGVTFVTFQSRMSEARTEMERELSGNPFSGLGELALQSVQLQWGWAVLVIGGVVICVAASMGSQQNK